MKFLASALLALVYGAQANKFSADELNDMVTNGMIDKERLLRNSVPAPRKLQNNYQYGNNNQGNSQYNQYSGYNGNNRYNGNNNQNNVNTYSSYSGSYQNNQANYYYQSGKNQNSQQSNNVVYGYNYTTYDEYGNAQSLYNSSASDYYYNDEQDYNLPYNGNYTVRFNKCMSFAIEDADLIADEELVYYAQNGIIVAQKSYVLFDIQECEPGSCTFNEADMSRIHMTTLEDFIASFIEYFPNKKEAYCSQCLNHYDYCTYGDGKFFDNAVFRNGGAFCYAGQQYRMINCGQCYSMGCLSGDNGDESDADVGAWIEEMAACKQTNTQWKDYSLYTGLTCNADGDGVEFGVFVDQNCKHYHKQKAFQNVIQEDDWQMLFQMPSVIEYMFTSSMSCKDDNEIKYMNAFQPVYGSNGNGGNYNNNNNAQNEADEEEFEENVEKEGNTCQLGEMINESCLDLFQYNLNGVSLADCLKTVPVWVGNPNYNENGNNNQNNNYDSQYIDQDWVANNLYAYELSANDLADMGKVCHIIANKYAYHTSGGKVGAVLSTYSGSGRSSGNSEHQNVYSADGSGSMFNYDAAKNNYYSKDQHDTVVNSWAMQKNGASLVEKLIFGLLGTITGVLMFLAGVRVWKAKRFNNKVEYVDKNLPLIA